MTREEAIYYLQSSGFSEEQIRTIEQAFTCENAVNRQDVLDLAKKGILISNGNFESVCKAINALPSVNPISKDRIIQIIEGHKGCQTQINLTLSKIIKEIETL